MVITADKTQLLKKKPNSNEDKMITMQNKAGRKQAQRSQITTSFPSFQPKISPILKGGKKTFYLCFQKKHIIRKILNFSKENGVTTKKKKSKDRTQSTTHN